MKFEAAGSRNDLELSEPVDPLPGIGVVDGDLLVRRELRDPVVADSKNHRGLPAVEPRVVDELLDVDPRVAGIAGEPNQKSLASKPGHRDLGETEQRRGLNQGDRVRIPGLAWSHDLEDSSPPAT